MARLTDKICIVTGGASGIGRAVSSLFAREGGTVVIADKNEAAAQEVAAAAGNGAVAMSVDVSDRRGMRAMVEGTAARFGRIDVLVNNAGYSFKGSVPDSHEDDWDRLIGVNLNGVFYGCKYAIPVMRAQGGGTIVNTASVAANVGMRDLAAYCASKGAIAALTRAMALDHAADRIRVNCVAPGTVDTPILDNMYQRSADPAELRRERERRHMLNRLAQPEEVAHGFLYLACDESSFVTGSTLTIDGGWTAQ